MKRLSVSVLVLGLMAACSNNSEEAEAPEEAQAPEVAAEEAPAEEATPEADMAMAKEDHHAGQHEAYSSMFVPCFEGTEGLAGSIDMSWTYAEGKATDIAPGDHTEDMSGPVHCMIQAVAAADFAGHDDGMVTHTITVNADGTLAVAHKMAEEPVADAAPAEADAAPAEEAEAAADAAPAEAAEEAH